MNNRDRKGPTRGGGRRVRQQRQTTGAGGPSWRSERPLLRRHPRRTGDPTYRL